MNTQVQDFLDKKNAEIKQEKQKLREKHLLDLGLTQGQECVWLDSWDGSSDCKYDSERGKYYKGTPKAIEVTDEEYDEICKVCPEGEINVQTKIETGAESTLTAIAICYLFAGGIGSILLFTIGIVANNISYIVGSIVCLMNTLLVWALLRCISNMSITLKQIKSQNGA